METTAIIFVYATSIVAMVTCVDLDLIVLSEIFLGEGQELDVVNFTVWNLIFYT